jgi:hypothetical protein
VFAFCIIADRGLTLALRPDIIADLGLTLGLRPDTSVGEDLAVVKVAVANLSLN